MSGPAPGVRGLAHYAVRTPELEAARRFYVEVLGFAVGPRPPFPFPGLWLYAPGDPSGRALVHLVGEDSRGGAQDYLGARRGPGGVFDHVAFEAEGLAALRGRWRALGIAPAERIVPELGQRQAFLADPAGVTVELTFPAGEGR